MYQKVFKYIIDLLLSFVFILVFSWLIILIMIIVKLTSKGPIFFFQKRVGKNKKYFNIIKFRTMNINTPKNTPTHLLKESDQYITSIGRVLRKTSLDEIPQLFNILLGQMSFVGPRPALWNQYDLIEEREKYGANGILPGLTGWAQINGRDEISIELKAKLDGDYVKRVRFIFDIKILIKTLYSISKHQGIREGGTGDL